MGMSGLLLRDFGRSISDDNHSKFIRVKWIRLESNPYSTFFKAMFILESLHSNYLTAHRENN